MVEYTMNLANRFSKFGKIAHPVIFSIRLILYAYVKAE